MNLHAGRKSGWYYIAQRLDSSCMPPCFGGEALLWKHRIGSRSTESREIGVLKQAGLFLSEDPDSKPGPRFNGPEAP